MRNALFRAYLAVIHRVMSRSIDLPPLHLKVDRFPAAVTECRDIAPHLRRITLHAPQWQHFDRSGTDEYIGLILPKPGQVLSIPGPEIDNIRSAVRKIPTVDLRWYTIRHHRPNVQEVDIDIVTHGTNGPGSTWALHAEPGREVGVCLAGSCHYPHSGPQLYVADPSAAPALWSILESMPTLGDAHVFLLGDDAQLEPHTPPTTLGSYRRGHHLEDFLRCPPLPLQSLTYAWICGESSLATGMRRALVAAGVPKSSIFFSGYWKKGAART